jgi:hypothetical protein
LHYKQNGSIGDPPIALTTSRPANATHPAQGLTNLFVALPSTAHTSEDVSPVAGVTPGRCRQLIAVEHRTPDCRRARWPLQRAGERPAGSAWTSDSEPAADDRYGSVQQGSQGAQRFYTLIAVAIYFVELWAEHSPDALAVIKTCQRLDQAASARLHTRPSWHP